MTGFDEVIIIMQCISSAVFISTADFYCSYKFRTLFSLNFLFDEKLLKIHFSP